jgi:hypothetical protein
VNWYKVSHSLYTFFAIWIALIVAFAICYFNLSYIPGHGSPQLAAEPNPYIRFLDSLYFSVITGATVGFGDIQPVGIARGFAAAEGIISFILLAVFVSRIASRRQDAAIEDIHSLARDSLFNNFRHALFICRKDLDKIIEKVEVGERLSERDWKNVRTSLRHMHTQMRNIPQLYAVGRRGEYLDEDHEQLVLDSLERSLRRARETIDILESNQHACRTDEKCMVELHALVKAAEHSFVQHHSRAENPQNEEAHIEVLARLEELKTRL